MDLSRLRVDQNGSLAAPRALQDAFARFDRGELPEAEFHAGRTTPSATHSQSKKQSGLRSSKSMPRRCWGLTARSS